MQVSEHIRRAFQAERCGQMRRALSELYLAFEETARREYGDAGDLKGQDNTARLITEHLQTILSLWPNMPIAKNLKIPCPAPELEEQADADGYCFLDIVLLWLMKRAAEEKELPVQWHTEPVLGVWGGALHLPTGLTWALMLLIVTRKANRNEHLEELEVAGISVAAMINELWGNERKLKKLFPEAVWEPELTAYTRQ